MKVIFGLFLTILCLIYCIQAQGNRQGPPQQRKVWCTHDSILFYHDCRMCVCPKPNRPAKCFRKSCDLRTKDSGQCAAAVLRMDDNKLCSNLVKANCKVDNDCPGQQLCCFDFCKGAQCMNPVPLDPGQTVHGGRGYP